MGVFFCVAGFGIFGRHKILCVSPTSASPPPFFSLPFSSSPRPLCLLLSFNSGPGCLRIWRFFFILPPPACDFFPSFLVRPLCLAFSGFRPRIPWDLALCVVCFVGLPLPGSLYALAVGCPLVVAAPPPPLPFLSRGFRRCRAVHLFFVFFTFSPFSSLSLCAPVVSGFLWFPAPGALGLGAGFCLFCWPPASVLAVRSPLFCVSRLAVACSLVVAAPPPPPFCVSRFPSLPLGAPFFFHLSLCAPVVSDFLWFPAPGALGLGAVCCLSCWHPASRLSVRSRLFCVGRLAVGCSLVVAAPPTLCVSRFSSLPLGAPFFFSLLLCSCLLARRSSAVRAACCPPPPPLVRALCLVLSGVAALCCPSVGCFALPCCCVPRCVPCCGAAPCCVVGCSALCSFCSGVCLCVVLPCWLLLRVVPCLWSSRPVGLFAVWPAVWFWSALPRAVPCWVSLGAVLRRAAARCAARCRAVVCCVILLRSFGAAACCAVPSGASPGPGALCIAALCSFSVPPRCVLCAVCVLAWRAGACCCSPLCCVLCVSWGVVLCVLCALHSVRCCASLCWCACVVLSVWCVLLLAPDAVVRCCVLCYLLCCSVVRCWVWGPWLSAGGVFRRPCPCLAAWCASLWFVWFAVVPCLPEWCSVVLCCRFAVMFLLALPTCGLSCCAVLCCWLSVLFFARWWCLCAVVPFPSLPAGTKTLIITLCYPTPVSVSVVHVVGESALAVRRCVDDLRGCL